MNERDPANEAPSSSGLQFLKDLVTKTAVYGVYLKKVTYTASQVGTDEVGQARVNFKTKEIRVIKAGSLGKLVDALVNQTGEVDPTYIQAFLATYRTFTSAKEVINLLLQRYRSLEDTGAVALIQRGIISVLSIWLDVCSSDFEEPPHYQCLCALRRFLQEEQSGSDLLHRVVQRLKKYTQAEDTAFSSSFNTVSIYGAPPRISQPKPSEEVVDFKDLPSQLVAEQLTLMDAVLYLALRPHECLGSQWNQRNKQQLPNCPTVSATIEQFNAIIYHVIATILKDVSLKHAKRGKIIEKWISTACELRVMKNFSSLRAIISGLQSTSIYRLAKVWQCVSKEHMERFTGLSAIFSEDHNQQTSRELLMKEGTAKIASLSTDGAGKKRKDRKSKATSKYESGVLCLGTIPYLGTFLTDLTMIDSAFPDYTDSGLINFEKRRKEFEVIAQIKLFQSAAKLYNVKPIQQFQTWFASVRTYNENESYALSCEIEPSGPTANGHMKKGSPSKMVLPGGRFRLLSAIAGDDDSGSNPDESVTSSVDSASHHRTGDGGSPFDSQSSLSSLESDGVLPLMGDDYCVIKVFVDRGSHSVDMYKCIKLSNKDRARALVPLVLRKFGMEDSVHPMDYCLVQLLDKGKELTIPDDANVFYAIERQHLPLFAVRHKLENVKRQNSGNRRASKETPKAGKFNLL